MILKAKFSRKEFMKYLSMGSLGVLSIPEFLKVNNSDSLKSVDNNHTSFQRAKLHSIKYDKPAVNFFEGALLGNGALGVVVTTRPDGIALRFGHNNVWDIRIAEDHKEEIGTFDYVFNKVKDIPATHTSLRDDPWFDEYMEVARDNYSKSYPRPFPCGTVILGFDPRNVELIGHQLGISNGLCEITLLNSNDEEVRIQIFTDMAEDKLWMRLIDHHDRLHNNIFDRIHVIPDPFTPEGFPTHKAEEELSNGMMGFRQILPYQEPEEYDIEEGHPKDGAFRLNMSVNSTLEKKVKHDWHGNEESMGELESGFASKDNFVACIQLDQGLDLEIDENLPVNRISKSLNNFEKSLHDSNQKWKEYWNKSAVKLEDDFLEKIWYRNLYFLNCSVDESATTPGLFANWSYNDIGTAWHGDYHMNYNTQQPFWVCFSSNHLEKNLSYVNLIEFLMEVSKIWAKEYYELPGAYFPHSAYPVDMTMNPYPVPTWGWEICETPWAVQGLWWHYQYSHDKEYLKNRAYAPIKEAVKFLVAYMRRPEARGDRWKDDKYHIFPTVPPELYGLQPGFKFNYDATVDLTLVKFIFQAFQEAVEVLNNDNEEKELLDDVDKILNHFPDYPTTESEEYGKIFVSVPGENDKVVYNVPNALITVFPGEDYGLHSDEETFQILENTFKNRQNEGGNDLVFKNLQAARIGMLNLKKFKRQVKYSLLPNGTAADMVMQEGGRYQDTTDYGFMDNMGIWFENFALPAVINECLMQSSHGMIRLFPNWPVEKNAKFNFLRAKGAFLVSSLLKDGQVEWIKINSEAGSTLKIKLPWETSIITRKGGKSTVDTKIVEIETKKGEQILFKPE